MLLLYYKMFKLEKNLSRNKENQRLEHVSDMSLLCLSSLRLTIGLDVWPDLSSLISIMTLKVSENKSQ